MTSQISDRRFVFDLDGTLLDTRQAVKEAYRAAGVEMPDECWGLPWREWLTMPNAAEIHKRKNVYYYKTVSIYAKRMPLFSIALQGQYPVITGASWVAVEHVLLMFGKLNVCLREADFDAKIQWLDERKPGTYVDDLPEARQRVKEATEWKVMSPEECLQWFSRRAKIPV